MNRYKLQYIDTSCIYRNILLYIVVFSMTFLFIYLFTFDSLMWPDCFFSF